MPGAVGIPTYANTWTLANPKNYGMGAGTVGAGKAGPNTATAGSLSYYEVPTLAFHSVAVIFSDHEMSAYSQ